MGTCYTTAFLIPASAKKILDEVGWLFETEHRLRPEVLDTLRRAFLLEKSETYLNMDVYLGDGVKATVCYDEVGLIENISIQLWTRSIEELGAVLCGESLYDIEIFIPDSKPATRAG